jgi:hypothetical protein
MERNENDLFDELVRGKLSNYTEPPEPEWIRSIQAKKTRVVNVYHLYRMMLIGIIVGAGLFAGIQLLPTQVAEQASVTPAAQQSATPAYYTSNPAEFASVVAGNATQPAPNVIQSVVRESLQQGSKDNANRVETENNAPVVKPVSNKANPTTATHKSTTVNHIQTNPALPEKETNTLINNNKEESESSEKHTETDQLQSDNTIPCKADFDFYTSYSGEFNFVHLSPIADNASATWDFGDGNESNATTVAHIFTHTGKYEVTLTITDAENTCTFSKEVAYQNPNEKITPIVLSGQVVAGSDILKYAIVELFAFNEEKGRFKSIQTVRTNQLGEYNLTLQRGTRYLLKGYPTNDAQQYEATFWGNTVESENASEIVVMPSEQDKLSGYTVKLQYNQTEKEKIPVKNPIANNNDPQQVFLVNANNEIVSVGSVDANGNYNFGNDVPAGDYNIIDPSTGASTPTTVTSGAKVAGKTTGGAAGAASSGASSDAGSKVSVYPNPANSVINFEINSSKNESAVVVIMDAAGVERSRQTIAFTAGLNQSQYDLTSFSPGIYYIMVFRNNQQVSSSRIVKLADTNK